MPESKAQSTLGAVLQRNAIPTPVPATLDDVQRQVKQALQEDIGAGDVTAGLIPATQQCDATIITREPGTFCGAAWVTEVSRSLDPTVQIDWSVADGQQVNADEVLLRLHGPSRAVLTGERSALNFAQLLSGTASACRRYADLVSATSVKLLDTRKTIPGLRTAQKYAVTQGGCYNHRMGLYDAFLIKENHIAACGSIAKAIRKAREFAPGKPVEIEVESMAEFDAALAAEADIIMLDNFSVAALTRAAAENAGRVKLEASGGVDESTIAEIAASGVDYISIGALTKHCRALDLSLRIDATRD